MKQALVLLAPGSEELEAVTIIDILRRGGVSVTVAGVPGDDVMEASRGVLLKPETSLASVLSAGQVFDLVALPGGNGGVDNLKSDPQVIELVKGQLSAGRLLAAICAAPQVLEAAHVLKGRKVTSYPGAISDQSDDYAYATEPVVDDGNLITSRGPGTALDFALHLVERLEGYSVRRQVEDKLVRS